jgi:hypothetical protein
MLLLLSCEEKVFTGNVDCNECYVPKPDSVDLVIKLTINDKYPEVQLIVFRNNIEDNKVLDTLYVTQSPVYYYVKANQSYSVRATYSYLGKTTIAFDGTHQQLKRVSTVCEEICWVIEDEKLNVQLQYD